MVAVPLDVLSLRAGLDDAIAKALAPLRGATTPLGILFSGGVDSALLAWELRDRQGVSLWTLGREGSDDLLAGKSRATRLGLAWHGMPIGAEDVRAADERFREPLEGSTPVVRAVLLSLALAIERAEPTELVCGQGVDELFLGYAHFRSLSEATSEQRSHDDLARLQDSDWPRTLGVAQSVGTKLHAPYLSPGFVAASLRIPISLRIPRDQPKRFFREWAVSRGLPADLALRPKKAMQYGSGVDALLRGVRRSHS
jgi:asparagine synthase (glutamine-hydrolysing)